MAAAFDRARAALDRRPPLSHTVESVLQRCGSNADLLLETVVGVVQPRPPLGTYTTAQWNSQYYELCVGLPGRPLLTALQEGSAPCVHCSPVGQLQIQSAGQSGSSVEGFMPVTIKGDITKVNTSSDVDIMLQLGPVHWEETDAICGGCKEAATGSGTVYIPADADLMGQQDDETALRLRVVPTDNPGFVLLYQTKREQCTHQNEHLFSGDAARKLLGQFLHGRWDCEVTCSGPATTLEGITGAKFDGMDLVPCLRANWWPSEEFFHRSRSNDWPPAAVRDDIRQFGIHLVPVGAKGSSTELDEFRLSFSRPEVVASWHLLPSQRNSLVIMKACKTALGPEGKPLKSYYLKTSLFWLCQDSDEKQWSSLKQGMCMIIDYLEKAIEARYLGCFFWSEINLFRQSTPADLAAMRHTLCLLRQNMTPLLAYGLSAHIETMLAPIILGEPCRLSERQLRVCLTRRLVISAVGQGLLDFTSPFSYKEHMLLQMFLRSSAAGGLIPALHGYQQQYLMLLALIVAPGDVMTQCRLKSLGNDMFSWDVAPLMGLLTREDLRNLLDDPAAIDAWLKDQHRLPAGLSSPRGLADLLLNPSLLAKALCECVPSWWAKIQNGSRVRDTLSMQGSGYVVHFPSFDAIRRQELTRWDSRATLAAFERLPGHGTQSVLCRYINSREKARQFLDDPQTRAEYGRLRCRLSDPWRLWQYIFSHTQ